MIVAYDGQDCGGNYLFEKKYRYLTIWNKHQLSRDIGAFDK
jgi:hypothetical protein